MTIHFCSYFDRTLNRTHTFEDQTKSTDLEAENYYPQEIDSESPPEGLANLIALISTKIPSVNSDCYKIFVTPAVDIILSLFTSSKAVSRSVGITSADMIVPSTGLIEVHTAQIKLPNSVPPAIGEVSRLQEDPGIRSAKNKLNYKKTFQDDHIFFPETHETVMGNPYRSTNFVSLNNPVSYSAQQFQPNQQHQQENFMSLLALKNLEKQHKQQQRFASQPVHRNGQVYYREPLLRHYGEQQAMNQAAYNYSNLRAQV